MQMIDLPEAEDLYCFQREKDDASKRMMSVTGIMRRAGLVRFHVPKHILERAATVGKQIHLVCHDIATGATADYWSQDSAVAPFAQAFLEWTREFKFRVKAAEQAITNTKMGYTGRIDLYGNIHWRTPASRPAVIEIKKGLRCGWHILQTSAYQRGLQEHGYDVADRYALYLKPGTYDFRRHPESTLDFSRLTGVIMAARLREEWGLVNERDEREFDQLLRGETTPERQEGDIEERWGLTPNTDC